MTASESDLIVIAAARARPGMEAELERALREAAIATRAQPGCVEFTLLRRSGDPSTLVGFERWTSEADHQNHLRGPHLQKLAKQFTDVLAGPPDIVAYEIVEE